MATIRKHIEETLVNHGLWPNEAEQVMNHVVELPENVSMRDRWEHDTEDYPPSIVTLAWMSAKETAIEHLKKTNPQHFALWLLEGKQQ